MTLPEQLQPFTQARQAIPMPAVKPPAPSRRDLLTQRIGAIGIAITRISSDYPQETNLLTDLCLELINERFRLPLEPTGRDGLPH